ncbi:hypothetical protein P3S67_024382 [Capsicum chacoense]
MKQKSRAQWIKLGDANTKYFSAVVKERMQRKTISKLTSLDGKTLTELKDIKEEIISFYKWLMGSATSLKAMRDEKTPGVDGYNAVFFKKAWPIIKHDIIATI